MKEEFVIEGRSSLRKHTSEIANARQIEVDLSLGPLLCASCASFGCQSVFLMTTSDTRSYEV